MIFNAKSSLLFLLTTVFLTSFAIAKTSPHDHTILDKQTHTIADQTEDKKKPAPLQIHRVLIYKHSSQCTSCNELFDELKKHRVDYHNIDLAWNRKQQIILERKAGKKDDSYVFIGNKYIGNHNDLMSIIKQGRLFRLLQE